jgi:hypothetical protein
MTKVLHPQFLSLMYLNKTKNISRYCLFKARLITVNTFNPTYVAVGSISWYQCFFLIKQQFLLIKFLNRLNLYLILYLNLLCIVKQVYTSINLYSFLYTKDILLYLPIFTVSNSVDEKKTTYCDFIRSELI